jgi:hypothetical protein
MPPSSCVGLLKQGDCLCEYSPGQADVDALFKDFVPMQVAGLPQYAGLLP